MNWRNCDRIGSNYNLQSRFDGGQRIVKNVWAIVDENCVDRLWGQLYSPSNEGTNKSSKSALFQECQTKIFAHMPKFIYWKMLTTICPWGWWRCLCGSERLSLQIDQFKPPKHTIPVPTNLEYSVLDMSNFNLHILTCSQYLIKLQKIHVTSMFRSKRSGNQHAKDAKICEHSGLWLAFGILFRSSIPEKGLLVNRGWIFKYNKLLIVHKHGNGQPLLEQVGLVYCAVRL